uniref:Uncharacterized protein n=1 Tax=Nelumbo nucifera TaxID=4432 RepID=A0A822XFX2_NELNU|nr:TPA_asm: hypothetical protein HUJ06_020753 [Nelumbo nucifera]
MVVLNSVDSKLNYADLSTLIDSFMETDTKSTKSMRMRMRRAVFSHQTHVTRPVGVQFIERRHPSYEK